MKTKPSWPSWLLWHGGFAWNQVQDAVEGALFAATVTWLFALYKWHKADCGI